MDEDEALPPPPPRAGERESREERAERLRREEIRCVSIPSSCGEPLNPFSVAWHHLLAFQAQRRIECHSERGACSVNTLSAGSYFTIVTHLSANIAL